MRRLSRLLRRFPRDAADRPAQEELETPTPAAVSCVSPRPTDLDQFSPVDYGDGMDRAHDASDKQAPATAKAGQAPATARSPAPDGMGGAAVARVAEAAPGPAAAAESAPDAQRAPDPSVVPPQADPRREVEHGQRVSRPCAVDSESAAPSAAVGARSHSAFAAADTPRVSLAHVPSQSDAELSTGTTQPNAQSLVAGSLASPKHAGTFDSAQSIPQPVPISAAGSSRGASAPTVDSGPSLLARGASVSTGSNTAQPDSESTVLLPSAAGSGTASSAQSNTQQTICPGSSSHTLPGASAATSANPNPTQSNSQSTVVLPSAAGSGSSPASTPAQSNTQSTLSPGSSSVASPSRGPSTDSTPAQSNSQPALPPLLPSTSAATPNPSTTASTTHLDPHVAIPLTTTPSTPSAPSAPANSSAQSEPPVISPPDPRVPRTLPLGTTMIVQGLVQTIEVNRPPVPTNQAPRTNRRTNEAANEQGGANRRDEGTNEREAISGRDEATNERDEEEPLLRADKDRDDKPDDKGEPSSGERSGQSSQINNSNAITPIPPRSTTPTPPPNFTSIPTRPGAPPPSSTDVLGLLLSIAAQATAEALVPWSVPPRSRAPASWTGASGREGIASGLAAAFSALAAAGSGGPPPAEPITVPAPPPPALEPVTIPAAPRRRESARRFGSRRLSNLVSGRAGSRQSSAHVDAEANDASATATINESSATATINEASAIEASATNEASANDTGSSSATTMSAPTAGTSTTNASSATNILNTSAASNLAGSNFAGTSTGSNLPSTSLAPSAAPKTERRRGVLGTLRRLVPWRSGSGSRPWRSASGSNSRRASAPQVGTPVRAAQVQASTPVMESTLVPPVDEAPLESQADPAPIVVSPTDEPIPVDAPAPEPEEAADFGRAPPTPVSPTSLPESSVSPSPTLAVPPSTIPLPPPPPPPTSLPPPPPPPTGPSTTDAEDLVRFSHMLGFTPGAVHPSGTFERFLADMQDELRAALGEYQERVRGHVRDERVEAAVPVDPAMSDSPAPAVDSSTPPVDSSTPTGDSPTPTPADTSRLLDHTRPHIPSTDPLPLNWWRMYRFPALPGVEVPPNTNAGTIVTGVSSSASSTSPPSSETSTESPESTSPPSSGASVESLPTSEAPTVLPASSETATISPVSTPSPEPNESPAPDENTPQPVHPAIIIGLRSVTRDPLDEPPSASAPTPAPAPASETATDDSSSRRDRSLDGGRGRAPRDPWARRFGLGRESGRREEEVERERETEERRSREGTRNYIIWIIGGYYPSGHPLLAHPNLFIGQTHPDELWMLNEFLGQVKPPTASREEIAKAGLRVVKGTEVQALASSGSVTENCTERCLICLDDYADEEDLRIMNCKHMFHKDCVDRWMETGRNNCPACRTRGVDTTSAA